MDLEDFLRLHGADLDQLVEGAQAVAPMQPGDRLIAVGSLAEGLGNRKSDVGSMAGRRRTKCFLSPSGSASSTCASSRLRWLRGSDPASGLGRRVAGT
jgi:hypothetical protein